MVGFMAGFGEAFQKTYRDNKEMEFKAKESQMDRNWRETMQIRTERRAEAQREKEAIRAGKAYAEMYANGDPDAAEAIARQGLAIGWDRTVQSLERGEFTRLKSAEEASGKEQTLLDAVENGFGNIKEENFVTDPKKRVQVERDTPEVRNQIEMTGDSSSPYKGSEDSKWGFRAKPLDPDANFKIRNAAELIYLEQRARARGDYRLADNYLLQIDAHSRADRLRTRSEEEGINLANQNWFYVINDGIAIGTPGKIVEQNGQQIVVDNNGEQIVADEIRPASKQLDERIEKFFEGIGGSEQYGEYQKQLLAYSETLGTTGRMDYLIRQYPELANMSGTIAKGASNLSENIKGVVNIVNEQFTEKPQGPIDAAKLQELDDVESRIDSLLSQGVTDIADAKALFDSLKEITTYKVLATLEEGKFSDTDVERIQRALQPADRPETILKNLNQINAILGNKIRGQYVQLSKNNPAVQAFQFSNGFIPPIEFTDAETYLNELGDQYAIDSYGRSLDPNSMYTPRTQPSVSVPAGAVEFLQQNPQARDQFDAKYGTPDDPNPSRRYLEGN